MIQNPILPGFCPDPSIVRVKEDYYIAVSTFEWWPGVRLFHTRDLEHFEQIPSPLVRKSQLNMKGNPDSCGVWAPDLSYDKKRFWLVFTDVKTRNQSRYYNTHNYAVWTEDILGEWSEPVYLNSTGFDPSFFHDNDGKTYLVNMINGFDGIQVQEFDKETCRLTGEAVNICKGSGRGFAEGPHLYHIGEWYYLMIAEGGTSYEHCETMFRSRSLFGPYEEDPDDPILTSDRNDPYALQKCGHADLVQTQAGEWYMVHLCARPNRRGKCVLGRETAIQKMYWNENGWLQLAAGRRYGRNETEPPKGASGKSSKDQSEKSGTQSRAVRQLTYREEAKKNGAANDDTTQQVETLIGKQGEEAAWKRYTFESGKPDMELNTLRIPPEEFSGPNKRNGGIRLYGREFLSSCFEVSLIAARQTTFQSGIKTCMEFKPETARQAAGIAYMYDTQNFYLFVKTLNEKGNPVLKLLKSDRGNVTEEVPDIVLPTARAELKTGTQNEIFLKAENDPTGERAAFFYSLDEITWECAGEVSTDILTDEHCVGFTGAHFGVYCHDMEYRKRYADFRYMDIRK